MKWGGCGYYRGTNFDGEVLLLFDLTGARPGTVLNGESAAGR